MIRRFQLIPYALVLFLFTSEAAAQTTFFPAKGIFNGFLSQSNIVECDNNNSVAVDMKLTMTRSDGEVLAIHNYTTAPSGSTHTILEVLASITDSIGTYTLELTGDSANLGRQGQLPHGILPGIASRRSQAV